MKKSTRKIIGNILVWGGLAAITFMNFLPFIDVITNSNVGYATGFVQTLALVDVISVIALLVGGLWWMRK